MKMSDISLEQMLKAAAEASKRAYAPYSKIRIGAALVSTSGKIFAGANIENSSYGLTVCAERVAISGAIFSGERTFKALAVYSDKVLPVPCGACLQMMAEFFEGNELVFIASKEKMLKRKFKELLPFSFKIKIDV